MSDDDRTGDNHTDDNHTDDTDPRLLSGARALDAVTPKEAAEFDRAAAASPALQDEADGLRETAGLLGLATAPVQPSERMKLDLMAKLGSTPQLPVPDAVTDAVPPSDAPVGAPEAATASGATASEATASGPTASGPTASGPAERRATARWFTKPVRIVVAAAAAVALFVGGGFVGSALTGTGQPSAQSSAAAALAEISAADDSQRASVAVDGKGTATLVWSNGLGRSAVLVDGLAPLPSGKVYEAWYIDDAGAAAAGTFTAAQSGTTWHVLEGAMSAGDQVGVTVEPAGGSQQPTTTPIVVLDSAGQPAESAT
jgi:hypothetical protein